MPHATTDNVTLGTPDWTNARFADGKLVAAWMKRQGEPKPCRSGFFKRSVYAMENEGRQIGFSTLDAMLVVIGAHPSELPDECWMHKRTNTLGRR